MKYVNELIIILQLMKLGMARKDTRFLNLSAHIIYYQYETSKPPAVDNNITLNDGMWQIPEIAVPLGIILAIISITTAAGNALVLYASYHIIKTEKVLHTHSNLFIASLAGADFIIGIFVMPVSSLYILTKYSWHFGIFLCQLWLCLDYIASASSILNLMAMSLDRYFSIVSPITYMQWRTTRRMQLFIGLIWLLCAIYAIPIVFWHHWFNGGIREVPETGCDVEFRSSLIFKLVSLVYSFIVPLVTMILVYIRIFLEIHKRTKKRSTSLAQSAKPSIPAKRPVSCKNSIAVESESGIEADQESKELRDSDCKIEQSQSVRFSKNSILITSSNNHKNSQVVNLVQPKKKKSIAQQKEIKAAKQLAFIMLAFTMCWLPYMILYVVVAFDENAVSFNVFYLSVWLGYINSTMNPILYPLCIDSFKNSFKKIFHLDQRRRHKFSQSQFTR